MNPALTETIRRVFIHSGFLPRAPFIRGFMRMSGFHAAEGRSEAAGATINAVLWRRHRAQNPMVIGLAILPVAIHGVV
jgi:hypothetical protein